MNAQPTINFDARNLARRSDPATSKAAAAQIAPRIGARALAVLALIKRWPGCTGAELAARDGQPSNHEVMRRVSILIRAGLIEVTCERACTVSGRLARAYRVTEARHG